MRKKISEYPTVTIVILNLDGLKFTRKCLKSLIFTKYLNYKIVVLDNGSRSNEYTVLKNEFPQKKIKFIRVNKNLGFAGGNNYVAKKINTKYIVFLNNDTVVDKNWLNPLVKEAEKDPQVSACQPKILSAVYKNKLDYAGAAGGFIDKYGHPFARGRIIFEAERDNKQYDQISDIVWASGAALFIRTKIFKKCQGFDEDFFIYHEETDLCWRIKEMGLKIISVPSSKVYHYGKGYTASDPPLRIFRIHRNMWFLILKHLPIQDVVFRIPLDVAAAIFYLINGQILAALSVFRVYFWMARNTKILKQKRVWYKKYFPRDFLYPRSIVLDYYLYGKKKFSELNW